MIPLFLFNLFQRNKAFYNHYRVLFTISSYPKFKSLNIQ
jgi:hypothetical protein